tara:strand:+ start:951 stop:1667 length:717 start_codon:yes stop_codon:yes gene_type:complete
VQTTTKKKNKNNSSPSSRASSPVEILIDTPFEGTEFTFGNFSSDDFDPNPKKNINQKNQKSMKVVEKKEAKKKKEQNSPKKNNSKHSKKKSPKSSPKSSPKNSSNPTTIKTTKETATKETATNGKQQIKSTLKNKTEEMNSTIPRPPKVKSKMIPPAVDTNHMDANNNDRTSFNTSDMLANDDAMYDLDCSREWLISLLSDELKTKKQNENILSCHSISFDKIADSLFMQLEDRPPGM